MPATPTYSPVPHVPATARTQLATTCRYARYAETFFQEDASGWQTFKYGKLGEVTENIRTFALPFESRTYTFKMQRVRQLEPHTAHDLPGRGGGHV